MFKKKRFIDIQTFFVNRSYNLRITNAAHDELCARRTTITGHKIEGVLGL